MEYSFLFSYPWWFLIFCLLAAALVAGILYWYTPHSYLSRRSIWILGILRFTAVFIISFLLLSPLIRHQQNDQKEPVILLFADNTASLKLSQNGEDKISGIKAVIDSISGEVEKDYSIQQYQFTDVVSPLDSISLNGKITDISIVFKTIDELYSNRNVGAVIIASDGIINRGINPVYSVGKVNYPVYTLALGDTVPHKDILINRLIHNRITFLGNSFPVEVGVEGRMARGSTSKLKIVHQGKVLDERTVNFTGDSSIETITFELFADTVGIKRYRLELEPVDDEISIDNNFREFFIEVIDARQKVLMVASGPHPDVGAIKEAIALNQNYEVSVVLESDFNGDFSDTDIVVWHQLPTASQLGLSFMQDAMRAGLPQLFILGTKTAIIPFNRLNAGMQVIIRSEGSNDSRAEPNFDFPLFQTDEEYLSLIGGFPPLQTHFATYSLPVSAQVFARQRIGNVVSDYPLIAFSEQNDIKTGFITGEGIWRWRLANFAQAGNHDAFNGLIYSIIQYLTTLNDKSFLRVNVPDFFLENQPVILDAEHYNKSYELVNTPDMEVQITSDDGRQFDYTFGRTSSAYRLNAGIFQPGEYTYTARAALGGDEYTASGRFIVSPLNLEGLNTVANHQLLFQLSDLTGGKLFYPGQWRQMVEDMKQREDIKPQLFTLLEYTDLIDLRWIFFLIILLFSVEWFIRKYSGGY